MLAVAIPLAQQRGEWRQVGDVCCLAWRAEPVHIWQGHPLRTIRYLGLAEEAYARAGQTPAGLQAEVSSLRQHLQQEFAKERDWWEANFSPEVHRAYIYSGGRPARGDIPSVLPRGRSHIQVGARGSLDQKRG